MRSQNSLGGARILIIGGTSGFGRQIAEQALGLGACVTIVGRSQKRLEQALGELRPLAQVTPLEPSAPLGQLVLRERQLPASPTANLDGYALDASDSTALAAFLTARKPFDHVVSMLGGAMGGGFMENGVDDVLHAVDAKFGAGLTVAKAVVPHIAPGGSITLTAGSGGHPFDASGAIVGNKAIEILVQGLAVELAPDIRVNAVAPTWTPTGLWRELAPDALAEQAEQFAQSVPLGRVACVEEVAQAYIFAMQCGYFTGQTLHIDGGVSAL